MERELNNDKNNQGTNVEEYKFEDLPPIKGFPELRWRGKQPFTRTNFYPAQLKETYGEANDKGWMNKIFWGDNLQVMSHLLKKYRGKVDLVYIDPPFDSKADYKKTIKLRGKEVKNDHTAFEEKQYGDLWNNDEYLQFMYERLILIRELLSDTGSIYLHCDWHKAHHLHCLMDEVFGSDNFRNEIIWHYRRWVAESPSFQKMHDTILFYTNSKTYLFNRIFIESTEGQQKKHEKGYDRNSVKIDGVRKPQLLIYNKKAVDDAVKQGKIDLSEFARIVEVKQNKTSANDFWEWNDDDVLSVNYINSQAKERTDYPTQKPEALLERIIKASSNEGDLIFDCFMGSGTTQAVAMKLGRRFIGADINLGAIETTVKRLNRVLETKEASTGFEVYNVNNYDIFRNPVEAKGLLMEALEINTIKTACFDGEKDGYKVKIMPVNRIANRQDLNDIITEIDYKTLERNRNENPNKPAESIMLVCMGHEPDLAAELISEFKKAGFEIEVKIVDILRNKRDLEFKHPSEAKIVKKRNKLIIEDFYPMNLLQKLSIQRQNVTNWKELVESVKIDWNFDGAVFEPTVVDYPEDKKDLVQGEYEIPDDAGTIKIKITDLLDESFETTLDWSK